MRRTADLLTRALHAPPPQFPRYPLQSTLAMAGLLGAAAAMAMLDSTMAIAVFTVFVLAGATWRSDMVPIMPFCMTYQWVSATAGYFYFLNVGEFPGGGDTSLLANAVLLSMLGLGAIALGWRAALEVFAKPVLAKTQAPPTEYNVRRLLMLTLAAFAVNYAVDVSPFAIWGGGAQIIFALLNLRFVPYMMLLLVAFEKQRYYGYVAIASAWVILPELLTGFSGFKEIFFAIIITAAAQWRPWIKEARQARINRQALVFAGVAAALVVTLGFAWTGAVKSAWRAQIWSGDVAGSPIEKMQLFFSVADDSVEGLEADDGAEALAGRLSSSSLYFSYVLQRVPESIPHENGALVGLAISNLKPRFLFPDKRNLGGDSWLVRQYAGIEAAGDESGASIGLGYLSEFYVDFGLMGIAALGFGWGAAMGAFAALLAKVSPTREVFFGLMVVLYMQYLMAYDGSFVKLFPGAVQLTIIAAVGTAFGGRLLMPWLLSGAGEAPAGDTRVDRVLRSR